MSLFQTKREAPEVPTDDRWLRSAFGFDTGLPVTLDLSKFTDGVTHHIVGLSGELTIPSGTPLTLISSSDLFAYGPFEGEVGERLDGFLKTSVVIPATLSPDTAVAALLPVAIVRVKYLPLDYADVVNLAAVKAGNVLAVLEEHE